MREPDDRADGNLASNAGPRDFGTLWPRGRRAESAVPTRIRLCSQKTTIPRHLVGGWRLMTLYHVDETQWVAKLAPRRAQQAYAAMPIEDAFSCKEVKKTILRCYGINEETYRQRFRATRHMDGEAYVELATCLGDLFRKWVQVCGRCDREVSDGTASQH
jgi:hypothetical protein